MSKKLLFYKTQSAKIVAITFLLGTFFTVTSNGVEEVNNPKASHEQFASIYILDEANTGRNYNQIDKEIKPAQKTYRMRPNFWDQIEQGIQNRSFLFVEIAYSLPICLIFLGGIFSLISFIHDSDGKKRQQWNLRVN